MIQKSYENNKYGKLYLVPTPIGNMEDITIRAINTLKSVDKIYVEDTRETMVLLKKYDIKKRINSCHKYSEARNTSKILSELMEGKNLAYVSDRGTPMICDPGAVIVKNVIEKGIQVVSLPGPCAFLPALNMSGLSNNMFIFCGFLSNRMTQRIEEMKRLLRYPETLIFYEAPHRIKETLKDMYMVYGNRNISIVREISKLHEEVYRGDLRDVQDALGEPRGEYVIILDGNNNKEYVNYVQRVSDLMVAGCKPSVAIREIATLYGVSKNKLYEECKELLL